MRLATRSSPLALAQARLVLDALERRRPGLGWELLPVVSRGDQVLDRPLADIGGKDLFVKALEERLADGSARAAAHSLKDVGSRMDPAFVIAGVLERDDPRDAVVSRDGKGLGELPEGAAVGTSSPRRAALIRHLHPHLRVAPVRGNVQTRLGKLDEGKVDALVLAVAGLARLGLRERIAHVCDPGIFIPAAGQGAIGIECLRKDREMIELASAIGSDDAMTVSGCERAVVAALGGDCHTPLGAHATLHGEAIRVTAFVGDPRSGEAAVAAESGDALDPEGLGRRAARSLLENGGGRILENLGKEDPTWQT